MGFVKYFLSVFLVRTKVREIYTKRLVYINEVKFG